MQPYPESRDTLEAQQEQLRSGHRHVQLFPGGRGELKRPRGINRIKTPNGDVFHYRPGKVTPKQIMQASKTGRENELLDLGPITKHEALSRVARGEHPVAVVERNKNGVETRAAAGTHATASTQLKSMKANAKAGHFVGVESPDETIARRADGGQVGPPPGFTIDPAPQGLPADFTVDKPATGTPTPTQEQPSAWTSALNQINETFNPYSATNTARMEAEKNAGPFDISGGLSNLGNVARGALAVPSLVMSPLTEAARYVIGKPYDYLSPQFTPEERAQLEAAGYHMPTGAEVADTAMSALAPARGGLPAAFGPKSVAPTPPVANGPLGVTLSEGQATGELPLIQREQAALRGTSGAPAQARAQEFFDQQAGEIAKAKEGVSRALDPYNMQVAASPQEAGDLVSRGMQQTAAARKAAVDAAYTQARSLPGEIHAGAFEGLPQKIKGDLTLGAEPVIIDQSTPNASKMIDYLDQKVGQLNIPNKADPFGAPDPQNIVGVSLRGVEQWRKALSAFRRDAMANPSDARAARAVMQAFDDRIDAAVNGGQFNGDPRAIQAWNDARAAHADYKSTFSAGKNDPTGRVIEKMLGKNSNPAAIPNDVADFLYGSSGVNPSSLNVNVANRVRSILGDQSPEWSAVKQGMFSRLVEPGPGQTDWGPGKIAQRINKFLNADGKELANTLYSPAERDMIQKFADLHRQLEVPQAGANWSNTSTFMANAMKRLGGTLGLVVGSAMGHAIGLPWGVAEGTAYAVTRGADKLAQAAQARAVAKQLPLVSQAMRNYQKAAAAYQKTQAPLSRTAMTAATANLARSLEPLGINLEHLWAGTGTVSAPADQNQQQ